MKSLSKITALLVMIAFVAVSCGKYEEGPKISLASKNARLINTWKINEIYKNGTTQTVTADQQDDYIEVKKDGLMSVTYISSGYTTTYAGTWEFTADKANLRLKYVGSLLGIPFTSDEEYTILRLTSDELWLEQIEGSNTFEYHYITK
ncbi:MAG: lipocalin family protein [Bacteroidales bacterium]